MKNLLTGKVGNTVLGIALALIIMAILREFWGLSGYIGAGIMGAISGAVGFGLAAVIQSVLGGAKEAEEACEETGTEAVDEANKEDES